MFKVELFFGFPVDPIFSKKLEKVNPVLFSQFVLTSGDYLKDIEYEGLRYLGKTVPGMLSFSELEMLETNIYSLLKKLIPDHPYEETPLYLFAMSHE